jgi:hypothetical protein
MNREDIASQLISITWQQGIIYPEQLTALYGALELILPEKFKDLSRMQAGEIARHLQRIATGEVWKQHHFRLIPEQRQGLNEAIEFLEQIENNNLDYEKGRYD